MFIAFAPFFVLVIFYMLAAIGLLWSPVAAYTCARVARSKGVDARRYAIAGAIYSILLFLPWIYLWSKLRNKPLRGITVAIGYVLLYALWLIGPISFMAILAGSDQSQSIAALVMLAMLVISLVLIKFANLCIKCCDVFDANNDALGKLICSPYLTPFVFAFVTLALFWLFVDRASPLT